MSNIIEIRERKFGENTSLICIPLVGNDEERLMKEVEYVLLHKPDLVEWRADYYDDINNKQNVLDTLIKLRKKIGDYPLIFTLRIDLEGGYKHLNQEYRVDLIKSVICTEQIDLVDYELINYEEGIRDIISLSHKHNIFTIISNHDFKRTPPKEVIINRLLQSQNMGADIAKIAVMPNSNNDVLELLCATNTFNQYYSKIPIITMSMSGKGLISRIGGGIFGSTMTFAAGLSTSAPGQIEVKKLREAVRIIEENNQ